MTSKAKNFNEYITSISTAPDSILFKVLPRFHMYNDLCIPPLSIEPLDSYHVILTINPNKWKVLIICPTDFLKIKLSLFPLLSVFSSTSS